MTTALFACVFINRVAIHVARRTHGFPDRQPLAVSSAATDRALLVDVCPVAARLGLHPGMSVGLARQRCPSLTVVPLDHQQHDRISSQIDQTLLDFADEVEQRGRGMWLVRLVALGSNYATAPQTLQKLHLHIERSSAFPCHVGAGPNRMIAMLAAQRSPHRHTIVLPGGEQAFLSPLPLHLLPGAGPDTIARCERYGIRTVGQLAALHGSEVVSVLGQRGRTLHRRAQGHDDPDEASVQQTIRQSWRCSGEPCADHDLLYAELRILTERAGRVLRQQQTAAGEITVRITWSDGQSAQHVIQCVPRRDLDRDLAAITRQILDRLLFTKRLAAVGLDVRLRDLGAVQRDLFASDDERPRKLQHALDTIRIKQGTGVIFIGALARRFMRKRAA
jgi:DNA polymerase IV